MPGKIDASLDKRKKGVKWGKYRVGDLFNIDNTLSFNADVLTAGDEYDYVTRTSTNQGILQTTGFVNSENINEKGNWSLGLLQMDFFYRSKPWYAGQFVRKVTPKIEIPSNAILYFTTVLNKLKPALLSVLVRNVDETFKNSFIELPKNKNNKIDFEFIESLMRELESEQIKKVSNYLLINKLNNYELSDEEKNALKKYQSVSWKLFNLEKLYGKSTRGKRLKSADRIKGELPFVTAGEAEEGVSAYIGNKTEIFEKNTITIDMFGSAKYRNYKYGADDHISVVHTEKIPMKAAIFVTAAIHRAAYTGKFNYGNNFYPKDADALNIMLPEKNKKPDYKFMENIVAAVQKSVIKEMILYVKAKSGLYKKDETKD